MTKYSFEGKTVEEATEMAEKELGVGRESLKIEVVEKKDKGVLGLSWGKKAIINAELQESASPETGNDAKVVLEKLLAMSGLEGEAEASETLDEIILDAKVDENDESLFIGRRGKNLDAYQYIVSRITDDKSGSGKRKKRVVVDCAGYRIRRKAKLESMARKAALIVKSEKKNYSFPPMQAGERKIIHMTIKEEGLQTESRGAGDEKKVIVFPLSGP